MVGSGWCWLADGEHAVPQRVPGRDRRPMGGQVQHPATLRTSQVSGNRDERAAQGDSPNSGVSTTVEVRWWSLASAIGYSGEIFSNVLSARFAGRYLKLARQRGLSTVPPERPDDHRTGRIPAVGRDPDSLFDGRVDDRDHDLRRHPEGRLRVRGRGVRGQRGPVVPDQDRRERAGGPHRPVSLFPCHGTVALRGGPQQRAAHGDPTHHQVQLVAQV
jgi:hypothetical protein